MEGAQSLVQAAVRCPEHPVMEAHNPNSTDSRRQKDGVSSNGQGAFLFCLLDGLWMGSANPWGLSQQI